MIFTGNMQTQLHKKIINMKNKKNTKHKTQIKRNNLKTKTHYLQGSFLAICKPNYTKKLRNMKKKKKTKLQTHQFKKKQFKDQNTLFTGIFTGNMQTQLHKKIIRNMKKKKKTKHQTHQFKKKQTEKNPKKNTNTLFTAGLFWSS